MVGEMARPKKPGPEKVNVGARVEKDVYDWFEAKAEAEHRTVSQLISFAMGEYRDRHAGNAPESRRVKR